MAVTRGQIKADVLTMINKTSGFQGFSTDDKLNLAIQECLDYVAVEMMMVSEGWLNTIAYLDIAQNTRTVALPAGVAIILAVRLKKGTAYYPLEYCIQDDVAQFPIGSTADTPTQYRIVGNNLYFNPAPAEYGTGLIELEYAGYTPRLTADADVITSQFDMAMLHFCRYRTASILWQQRKSDGTPSPYAGQESQWYDQMMKIVSQRVRGKTFVQDFQV